jgi:hypothetical protein
LFYLRAGGKHQKNGLTEGIELDTLISSKTYYFDRNLIFIFAAVLTD